MDSKQTAVLLSLYHRELDHAIDKVGLAIPDQKVMLPGLLPGLMAEQEYFPLLEPVYEVLRNMQTDIDMLGRPILMVEEVSIPEQLDEPEPAKGKAKDVITFEQDHICVNGCNLGAHDLLMYARQILKVAARKEGIDVSRMKVALEDIIEANQHFRGIEEGARMPLLTNGDEV